MMRYPNICIRITNPHSLEPKRRSPYPRSKGCSIFFSVIAGGKETSGSNIFPEDKLLVNIANQQKNTFDTLVSFEQRKRSSSTQLACC